MVAPTVLESLFSQLSSVISTAMIGRLATMDISAKGISDRLLSLLYMLFMGIGIGTTVLIATQFGRGQMKDCRRTSEQAFLSAVPLALLISPIVYLFAPQLLAFFSSDETLIASAVRYLRRIIWVLPFFAAGRIVTASFHGMGDTRTPMAITLFHNVIGIIASYIAIFGLGSFGGWGLEGCGITAVITQAIASGIGIAILYRKKHNYRQNPHGQPFLRLNRSLVGDIFSTGIPAAAESMCVSLSFIIMARVLLTYGTNVYSAYQLGVQAELLCGLVAAGFTTVSTTTAAMAIGQRNDALFREYFRQMRKLALYVGCAAAAALFLLPGPLMRILTDKPELQQIGVSYLRVMGVAQIPQILAYIYIGFSRASGYKRITLLATVCGIWGVRIPVALLCAYVLKVPIICLWFGILADQLLRITISTTVFRRRHVIDTVANLPKQGDSHENI